MSRLRHRVAGLIVAGLLTACSSTLPQSAAVPPDTSTTAASRVTPITEPTAEPIPSEGPVTVSMAKHSIDGERYAALGDPNAPITVVEFSDYGCPFCRLYVSSTLPEIKSKYIDTGQVYYVFKDFPVVSNHPQAALAAQAAECAGDQNSYWQMHDALFAEPSEWDTTPEDATAAFHRYAETLELDADALRQCVEQGTHADEVARDNQNALRLGLTGTPSFIINGRLMSGARPTEQFIQVFDRELSQR